MTRVLVIDDSVLVRRLVTRALEREPAIEVVGAARNGRAAVAKAEALRPDVVVLDSEVAGSDGFATLAELRRERPDLGVVIFSQDTGSGAERGTNGAMSFAFKAREDGIGLSEQQVRMELLPAIRRIGVRLAVAGPEPVRTPGLNGVVLQLPVRVEAIVIGVSTGGPEALATLIGSLPADLPVPVLVVQHMPPDFTRLLAERLDRHAAVSVVEASAGDLVRPGRVYIAPGGHHMALAQVDGEVEVVLHDGPRENSCRPAADVLFRSAADVYGKRLVAVVLTGMGRDGLRGAEAVRAAGGWVIAQTQDSATIGSMPAAVEAAGLANAVVRLEDLAHVLTSHAVGG